MKVQQIDLENAIRLNEIAVTIISYSTWYKYTMALRKGLSVWVKNKQFNRQCALDYYALYLDSYLKLGNDVPKIENLTKDDFRYLAEYMLNHYMEEINYIADKE